MFCTSNHIKHHMKLLSLHITARERGTFQCTKTVKVKTN
uniref:Uncharacterized protein n=1 Tax=Manihot esculenta TaxID=3983 RepID=A0A2C9VMS2_MANES